MTTDGRGRLVFLTGATGFIGGRLARALDARGYRLRCLVRAPERAAGLVELGAELVVGDVTDAGAMAQGVAGAGLCYHLAAVYAFGAVDARVMERANVDGTRRFLEAAEAAGVARVVHVSSTVALEPAGPGAGPEPGANPGPYPTEYHRTKAAAHRLAQDAQARGVPVVIACPGFVYGPGDQGPPALYMADLLRHRVPGLSTRPTHYTYVHVDDVVDGLIAVGERGRPGATYVLGGQRASVNEYTGMLGQLAETWVSPLRFPPSLVRLTGGLMDAVGRLTGWRMPISRELAVAAGSGAREDHTHELAAAELGYAPRALAEGLPEAIRDVQERLTQ